MTIRCSQAGAVGLRPRTDPARRPLDDAATPSGLLLAWAESALRADLSRSSLIAPGAFEIFGQGSRVNGTHLDHTADIDLVLMLTQPLPYGWEQFRDGVLAVLGESHIVRMGRRCCWPNRFVSFSGVVRYPSSVQLPHPPSAVTAPGVRGRG